MQPASYSACYIDVRMRCLLSVWVWSCMCMDHDTGQMSSNENCSNSHCVCPVGGGTVTENLARYTLSLKLSCPLN